jgi:hypothetical protein
MLHECKACEVLPQTTGLNSATLDLEGNKIAGHVARDVEKKIRSQCSLIRDPENPVTNLIQLSAERVVQISRRQAKSVVQLIRVGSFPNHRSAFGNRDVHVRARHL